jgi:nucleoside recognition membrane protein YjiH
MRASIALLGGIVMLFVGWQALGTAATNSESAAQAGSNQSAAAWNMSEAIYSGLGEAAGPSIVWMGVAAFILVACGVLVAAARGGGR